MKGHYPEYAADPITDVRQLFLEATERFADRVALQHKRGGTWIPILYRELHAAVRELACGFASLGLDPIDRKLALVGENRPEWAVAYLAAACTGIVLVPIDKELRETEVYHILHMSGADALVGDRRHVEMVEGLRAKLPRLRTLVDMDGAGPAARGLDEIQAAGRARIASGRDDFAERTVTPDDLLSILFTSGTMGNSKGVMLSHRNVASNLHDAARWVDLRASDRFLSVLPMHHAYECTDGFLMALYRGAVTSYAESLRRVVENLAETRSTVVLGVPALWHAMYKRVEAGMAEKGVWKVELAKKIAGLSEKVLGRDIRRRLFHAVHQRFGGELRTMISGGAAIDPRVARGFRELGFTFLQGYGLTESAPIITVNRDRAFRDDAAGLPLPSVEVRIADDGEILARGPNIMQGYYNNPHATGDTLADGWLHTGDLGYLDDDGFLHIQGRKKAVIVTPGGKKIYPEEVEAELLRSPAILEALVWGESTNDPGRDVEIEAIVVPNGEWFLGPGAGSGEPVDPARIEQVLRREVKERCLALAPFKRVTRLTVRHEEFEKTTTRKIKRYLYTTPDARAQAPGRTESGEARRS